MKLLIPFLVLVALLVDQRKPGNPLDNLPVTIEVLTHFGERADISPDNQRVAFMSKSFGDAMVIDLKTRIIQCLTCNVPGAAFLRVMHLVTGDYILIGPDHFENTRISRTRDNELWFLSKERGSKPMKLGQEMSEGAAISKKSLKIAFSQTSAQAPDRAPEASRLIVADVDILEVIWTNQDVVAGYQVHHAQECRPRHIACQALDDARLHVDDHRITKALGHKRHTLVIRRNVCSLTKMGQHLNGRREIVQRIPLLPLIDQQRNQHKKRNQQFHAGNPTRCPSEVPSLGYFKRNLAPCQGKLH